jgi:hypothetical protein
MDTNSPVTSDPAPDFQPQKGNLFTFLKKNALLLCAVILVLFFFYILYLSAISTSKTPENQPANERGNTTVIRPTTIPTLSPTAPPKKSLAAFEKETPWTPEHFSNIDFGTVQVSSTSLPDGSTKYTYPSLQSNRPNELTVKDDIIIAKRTVVTQRYIYHYTNTLTAPDFTFFGSKFYGPDTTTYVYLKKGIAFVADSKSTMVKEQLIFQPTSLEDFKLTFGEDISSFTVVPTHPDE